MNQTIISTPVPEPQRLAVAERLFGVHFPLQLEPRIFTFADHLSTEYKGGYWDFFTLSNGGFYMAPNSGKRFTVRCQNGFEGNLSADAFGITACLYAYSHLSFTGVQAYGIQFHRLREFAMEHAEGRAILAATD